MGLTAPVQQMQSLARSSTNHKTAPLAGGNCLLPELMAQLAASFAQLKSNEA